MAQKRRLTEYAIEIEDPTCPICCAQYYLAGVFPCGHVACAKCTLTQFLIRKQKVCLLCNEKAYTVLVIYQQYQFIEYKRLIGLKQVEFQKKKGLYVHYLALSAVQQFFCPACKVCNAKPRSFGLLNEHLKAKHKMQYCRTCLQGALTLPVDYRIYGDKELKEHLATHPRCCLCRRFAYDAQALYQHYKDRHERCEICRAMGIYDSYWSDASALCEHIAHGHIQCRFRACQTEAIGFSQRIDYLEHLLSCHFEYLYEAEVSALQSEAESLQRGLEPATLISALAEYSISNRETRKQAVPESRLYKKPGHSLKNPYYAEEIEYIEPEKQENHDSAPAVSRGEGHAVDFSTALEGLNVELLDMYGESGATNETLLLETPGEFFNSTPFERVRLTTFIVQVCSDNLVFLDVSWEKYEILAVRFSTATPCAHMRISFAVQGDFSLVSKEENLWHLGCLFMAFFTAGSAYIQQLPSINARIRVGCETYFRAADFVEVFVLGIDDKRSCAIDFLQKKIGIPLSGKLNERYRLIFDEQDFVAKLVGR